MQKLGIVLNSPMPTELNRDIFNKLKEVYNQNPLVSIDLFFRDINWPYKPVDYGLFKLMDYQNFSGPTIITDLALFEICQRIPNNNSLILYCHDFPWLCNFSLENGLAVLTSKKYKIYCRYPYIRDMLKTFEIDAPVIDVSNLIDKYLGESYEV